MKVSTESMSASASSSLAATAAAMMTDRLATRFVDGTATSPLRRWLFPENGKGVGACDEDGGEEEEVVEGRKVGDARTWSIAAAARGALFYYRVAFGWRLCDVPVRYDLGATRQRFYRLLSIGLRACDLWLGRQRGGIGVWARVVAAVRARTRRQRKVCDASPRRDREEQKEESMEK